MLPKVVVTADAKVVATVAKLKFKRLNSKIVACWENWVSEET
jgi:hypothetical protein